jgi:hypothetical protein
MNHATDGGARERWDLVSGLETKTAIVGGAIRSLTDCGIATAFTGGGGSAAINIRHPTQQQSAQILPLLPSVEGATWPARSVWQMMPPGCPAVAACAAPKLPIRPDSAIA